MVNLTPRIVGLAQNGIDPFTISHILGITLAQVEEGLQGRVIAGGGGSGIPTNWCKLSVQVPEVKEPEGPPVSLLSWESFGTEKPADALTITSQAGDDFTVAEENEEGVLKSTAGGLFYVIFKMSAGFLPGPASTIRQIAGECTVGENHATIPLASILRAEYFFLSEGGQQLRTSAPGALGYTNAGGIVASEFSVWAAPAGEGDVLQERTLDISIFEVGLPAA